MKSKREITNELFYIPKVGDTVKYLPHVLELYKEWSPGADDAFFCNLARKFVVTGTHLFIREMFIVVDIETVDNDVAEKFVWSEFIMPNGAFNHTCKPTFVLVNEG